MASARKRHANHGKVSVAIDAAFPSAVAAASDPAGLEAAVRSLVHSQPGRRLPPERELAVRFGASRPRLRAVLACLQSEGLIESRQGSGTFATAPPRNGAGGSPTLRRVSLVIDAALKLGDDPLFSLLLERLQEACDKRGAACVLSRYHPGDALPPPEDGQLTIGLDAGNAALAAPSPRQSPANPAAPLPPLVALLVPADARPTRRVSVIQLDDFAAGVAAAEDLLTRHDCRCLLFWGRDSVPASRERRLGAASACEKAGVSLQYIPCALNYAAGLAAARALPAPGANAPKWA